MQSGSRLRSGPSPRVFLTPARPLAVSVAIPVISYLAAFYSWQTIFIMVGITGLLWLIPWLVLVKAPPKSHPWITDKEKEYILTGQRNQDLDQDGEFDEGYNPPRRRVAES